MQGPAATLPAVVVSAGPGEWRLSTSELEARRCGAGCDPALLRRAAFPGFRRGCQSCSLIILFLPGQSTAAPPPRRLGRRATIGASWPPANGRIRLPVSVPGLSASPESSRRRPSSTKSTASCPCFVSGRAASQRPPLHRALLDPKASPKAQSAAALLRPRRPPAGEQQVVAAGMNAASSSSPPASGHVLDRIRRILIVAPSPAAA